MAAVVMSLRPSEHRSVTSARREDLETRRPLPLGGGGPFLLTSAASLEKRGEGVTLNVNTPAANSARVTPSPDFSKLASSLRKTALPHQGGGGVSASAESPRGGARRSSAVTCRSCRS